MDNNSAQKPPEILQNKPQQAQTVQTPPPDSNSSQAPEMVKKTSKFSIKAIIGAIIFLLLAGSAAAGYVYREPIMKLVSAPTPTPSPIVTITPTPDQFKTSSMWIAEFMEFGIPNGWTEESKENIYYSLNSPDSTYSKVAAKHIPTVTINISKRSGVDAQFDFDVQFNQLQKSLNDPQNENPVSNLTKTSIGGFPAYIYEYSFEGFSRNYSVKVRDTWWDIVTSSPNKENLEKYSMEIDDFLKSIKFLEIQTIDTSNWKTFYSENGHFELKHPTEFDVNLTKSGGALILNHTIVQEGPQINDVTECLGDCPVVSDRKEITLNGYTAKKIKGYYGEVGGMIPHSYIKYQIQNPISKAYLVLTLHEIPQDLPYQELGKKYGFQRSHQPIPAYEEKLFDQILSTFKFTN